MAFFIPKKKGVKMKKILILLVIALTITFVGYKEIEVEASEIWVDVLTFNGYSVGTGTFEDIVEAYENGNVIILKHNQGESVMTYSNNEFKITSPFTFSITTNNTSHPGPQTQNAKIGYYAKANVGVALYNESNYNFTGMSYDGTNSSALQTMLEAAHGGTISHNFAGWSSSLYDGLKSTNDAVSFVYNTWLNQVDFVVDLKQNYNIKTFNVIFEDWNGATLKTQTVNYNTNASPPSNPSRTGYTFTGWAGIYTNVTSNRTITAQYTENQVNTYTVTFKDHDGTTLKIHTVPQGYDAIPPNNPTRVGYIFIGWSGTYTNVTSNQIVTAQYSQGIFLVTFKDHDGTTIKTETVTNGTIDLYTQNSWEQISETELYLWGFISSIDNKMYISGKTVDVTQNITYQAVLSETLPRTYENGYADAMAQEDFSFWQVALSSVMLPFTILSIELMPGLPIGIFALIPIVFGLIAFFFSFKGGKKS